MGKDYAIISEKTFEKARNEIRKASGSGKRTLFISYDDEIGRKILEKEKVDVFMPALKGRRDFQKQRNSGFNHVLAKLAAKGGVAVGVSLDEIIGSRGRERAEILARIRQNIILCGKNDLGMRFIALNRENARDVYGLKSLGSLLGMPTWMTRDL
jgi:RNase P/RNase MRP subunit p30